MVNIQVIDLEKLVEMHSNNTEVVSIICKELLQIIGKDKLLNIQIDKEYE